MEENLNNNEVNNNLMPNNNYYEPKKNNGVKILLAIVIILLLVGIGLFWYKMFILDKKEPNNKEKEGNKVEEKTYEKINYEIKEDNDDIFNRKVLYVTDKKVDEIVGESLEVEQYKDVLIVKEGNPGPSSKIYAVYKNGDLIKFDYAEKERVGELFSYGPEEYRWEESILYIKDQRQYGNGYIDWYCRYQDKNAVIDYEVKYEYLGEGKFSAGTIVNEKTIAEVYKEELKTCSIEYDKINYEIKDGSEGWKELYIDGKKVKLNYLESINVEQYKDILLVKWSAPGAVSGVNAVYKDGTVTELNYKFNSNKGIDNAGEYRTEDNKIYVKRGIYYSNAYFDYMCRITDVSTLSSYEVKYEYLGNGKFSKAEIVNKKTIKDDYSGKCDDVIAYKDIFTNKLCSRKSKEIKCYSDTTYDGIKNRLIEIYGENNCSGTNEQFECKLNDIYCILNADGDFWCDSDREIIS